MQRSRSDVRKWPAWCGAAIYNSTVLDVDACYRALLSRDRRFDGMFFVGVSTTGVYCRPVCSARTPRRDRCSFHRSAAEAEGAGFRACFVCRPEVAPGRSRVDAVATLVERAVTLVGAGFLEGDGSVDALAAELGVSSRHLRRACEAELGASPVALAQTRRLATAKQLLHDTNLPLADLAFASGFSSVRRFNALFSSRFGRPPSAVRRARAPTEERGLVLRLDLRPPFAFDRLLSFLAARAIEGVELVTTDGYARVVRVERHVGVMRVRRGGETSLRVELDVALSPVVAPLMARVRALFDLDARPDVIAAQLGTDPLLRRSVEQLPGLRVPGAFDGFETAVRAILGQQVSVRAATTLAGRLVSAVGAKGATAVAGLTHSFPSAAVVADATPRGLSALGLPATRAAAIRALARAVADGALALSRGADPVETRARLLALPGVGPWTASYVAMRALGEPDAFVASDLVVRRALGDRSPTQAEARSERWRPFRAYAVMHLWNAAATRTP